MHWPLENVVFRVGIRLATEKDQTFLHSVHSRECHLEMELLLIHNLNLQVKIGLCQEQLGLVHVLRYLDP